MEMKLTDKTALVTGVGRGLGRAIALALAHEGAVVAVTDTDANAAAEVAREIGSKDHRSLALPANVGYREEVERVFDDALANLGKLDILVTHTGIVREAPLPDIAKKDWDEALRMNLKSAFLCTQMAYRNMRERQSGSIVHVAPVEGWTNNWDSICCATRAGIAGLTRACAKEASRYNIRVNSVFPPTVKMTAEDLWKVYVARISLGCLAEQDDAAQVVAFLASDESKYITGQILGIE